MEELVWKPKFKRSQNSNTDTTRLAAKALEDLRNMERMRSIGTLDHHLEKMRQKPKPIKKTKSKFHKAILLTLLLPPLAFLIPWTTMHEVKGILRNERSPLQGAKITLHGKENKETSSDQQGKFSIAGVKPGEYKISVEHKDIDPNYADPGKTPFKINVIRDIESLHVHTKKKMPAQKKRTPGID